MMYLQESPILLCQYRWYCKVKPPQLDTHRVYEHWKKLEAHPKYHSRALRARMQALTHPEAMLTATTVEGKVAK